MKRSLLEANGNRAAESPRPRRTQVRKMCPHRSQNHCAAIIAAPSRAHQEPAKRLKSPLNRQSRHTRQTQSA
jgi:hypothetical protein